MGNMHSGRVRNPKGSIRVRNRDDDDDDDLHVMNHPDEEPVPTGVQRGRGENDNRSRQLMLGQAPIPIRRVCKNSPIKKAKAKEQGKAQVKSLLKRHQEIGQVIQQQVKLLDHDINPGLVSPDVDSSEDVIMGDEAGPSSIENNIGQQSQGQGPSIEPQPPVPPVDEDEEENYIIVKFKECSLTKHAKKVSW